MRTNKFSIGGLIEVRTSSIVYWSYEDNFKPVFFFFFTKRFWEHKNTSHPEVYASLKNCWLCCLALAYFFLLADFCLWHVFVRTKSFRQKKTNRLEIVLITSIYYTTIVMPQHFYFNRYMFALSTAKSRFKFIVCWIV